MASVLFVCTGNSARSILAESLLNHLGGGRFTAFSAGSHPAGEIASGARRLLEQKGLPIAGLHSKGWDLFAGPDAPPLDIVITVCDNAASSPCPVWPAGPARAHWGLPDPAAISDPEDSKAAFEATYETLARRIARLVELPVETLDRAALEAGLNEIGETEA